MGVRGSENKKQKETTETNNQKDERNDKTKNTHIREKSSKTIGERRNQEKQDLQHVQKERVKHREK